MSKSCPVPTPDERTYDEIQSRIETALKRKVYAALRDAAEQARTEIEAAGLDMPPPSHGYFASTLHQSMFCTLCGADPATFEGGRADTAIFVIRNMQNIAKHYWGADADPSPRTPAA